MMQNRIICVMHILVDIFQLRLLTVMLGQQFDSTAMQQLLTAIKIHTHRNFRPTVSSYVDCFPLCKLQHILECLKIKLCACLFEYYVCYFSSLVGYEKDFCFVKRNPSPTISECF